MYEYYVSFDEICSWNEENYVPTIVNFQSLHLQYYFRTLLWDHLLNVATRQPIYLFFAYLQILRTGDDDDDESNKNNNNNNILPNTKI